MYPYEFKAIMAYWLVGYILLKIVRAVERHTGAGPVVPIPKPWQFPEGLKPEDKIWFEVWSQPWKIWEEEEVLELEPVPAQRALEPAPDTSWVTMTDSKPKTPRRMTKQELLDVCEKRGIEADASLSVADLRSRIYMHGADERMARSVLSDFTALGTRAKEFGSLARTCVRCGDHLDVETGEDRCGYCIALCGPSKPWRERVGTASSGPW